MTARLPSGAAPPMSDAHDIKPESIAQAPPAETPEQRIARLELDLAAVLLRVRQLENHVGAINRRERQRTR